MTRDDSKAVWWQVWGRGQASAPEIREADAAAEWPQAAYDDDRMRVGVRGPQRETLTYDAPGAVTDDAWCVEVLATEDEIDALTRHDSRVYGYVRAEWDRQEGRS